MRFAYITDIHLCYKRPGKRTDENFFVKQLGKLEFIIDYCIKNGLKVIMCGGDFFDSSLPADSSLINAVIPIMQRFQNAGGMFYCIRGSHDVIGYNLDAVKDTPLGTLVAYGLVRLFEGEMLVGDTYFYGISATLNHTVDLYKFLRPDTIVISHNMLTPAPAPFEHILLKDVAIVPGTIFLCAHYHKHFFKKINGCVFYNPGPIVRTDKSEGEHEPMLTIVDPIAEQRFRAVIIPHEKNVFDLSTPDIKIATPFAEAIQLTEIKFFDLFDLTTQIATTNKVAQPVLDEAIRRIEDAQRNIA